MILTKVIKLNATTIGFMSQPYASCDKWEDDVESSKDTTKQMKKFKEGATVTTLIGSVSKRLGFSKTLDIGTCIPFLELSHTSKCFPESSNCICFKL
jgi:hypothetical protein